jgi:hypothetical protein
MSVFHASNYVNFKMNGEHYILPKSVIQKMGIFNVLEDCNSEDILSIDVDLDRGDIDDIFNLISENDLGIIFNTSENEKGKIYTPTVILEKVIRMIHGMKYLAIEIDYIKKFAIALVYPYTLNNDILSIKLFELFKTIPYDGEMKFIIETAIDEKMYEFKNKRDEKILNTINIIRNDASFPENFKYAIIKLLIAQNIYFYSSYSAIANIAKDKNELELLQEGNKFNIFGHNNIDDDLKTLQEEFTSDVKIIKKIEIEIDYDNNWIIYINNQKIMINQKNIYTYEDELNKIKIDKNASFLKKVTVEKKHHFRDYVFSTQNKLHLRIHSFHIYLPFLVESIMNS